MTIKVYNNLLEKCDKLLNGNGLNFKHKEYSIENSSYFGIREQKTITRTVTERAIRRENQFLVTKNGVYYSLISDGIYIT